MFQASSLLMTNIWMTDIFLRAVASVLVCRTILMVYRIIWDTERVNIHETIAPSPYNINFKWIYAWNFSISSSRNMYLDFSSMNLLTNSLAIFSLKNSRKYNFSNSIFYGLWIRFKGGFESASHFSNIVGWDTEPLNCLRDWNNWQGKNMVLLSKLNRRNNVINNMYVYAVRAVIKEQWDNLHYSRGLIKIRFAIIRRLVGHRPNSSEIN